MNGTIDSYKALLKRWAKAVNYLDISNGDITPEINAALVSLNKQIAETEKALCEKGYKLEVIWQNLEEIMLILNPKTNPKTENEEVAFTNLPEL